MSRPATLGTKHKAVVLVGAGNAHLAFIRRWRTQPTSGIAVVLVNESSTVPYSQWFPLTFRANTSVTKSPSIWSVSADRQGCPSDQRVAALHPSTRQVAFVDRSPLTYDVLSLGIGSVPPDITRSSDPEFVFTLRPLATLIDRLQRPDDELRGRPRLSLRDRRRRGERVRTRSRHP